jgi:hypothetical protein
MQMVLLAQEEILISVIKMVERADLGVLGKPKKKTN